VSFEARQKHRMLVCLALFRAVVSAGFKTCLCYIVIFCSSDTLQQHNLVSSVSDLFSITMSYFYVPGESPNQSSFPEIIYHVFAKPDQISVRYALKSDGLTDSLSYKRPNNPLYSAVCHNME